MLVNSVAEMLRELEAQGQGLDPAQGQGLGSRTETRASETVTSFSVASSGGSKHSGKSNSEGNGVNSSGVTNGGDGTYLRMEVEEEGANDTMGSGNTLDLIRDVQLVVQGEEDHTIMTISSLGTIYTHLHPQKFNLYTLNTPSNTFTDTLLQPINTSIR